MDLYIEEMWDEIYSWHELKRLDQAIDFAKKFYLGYKCIDGYDRFLHNLDVCKILSNEYGKSSELVLTTAILQNVFELSEGNMYSFLKQNFGTYVANGVLILTQVEGQETEEFIRFIAENDTLPWAILIKLSDQLCLLRRLSQNKLNNNNIINICEEIKNHYLPHALKFSFFTVEYISILDELERVLV